MIDNWKLLQEEYTDKYDSVYTDDKGVDYLFFGLVEGADDYYYGMSNCQTGKVKLLSCVGHIEAFGYTLKDQMG